MPRFVTFDARQTKIPRRVCVLWTESLFSAQTVQTDQRSCTFSTFEETTHRVHASPTRSSPIFRGEPCFSPRFQRIHPDWKLELSLFKYLYINFHCSKGDVARVFGDRERRLVYIYMCACIGNACEYLRGGVVVVVVVVGVVLTVVLLVVVISQVSVGSVVVHLVTSGIWLSSTCSTTVVTVVVLTGDLVVDKTVVVVVLG